MPSRTEIPGDCHDFSPSLPSFGYSNSTWFISIKLWMILFRRVKGDVKLISHCLVLVSRLVKLPGCILCSIQWSLCYDISEDRVADVVVVLIWWHYICVGGKAKYATSAAAQRKVVHSPIVPYYTYQYSSTKPVLLHRAHQLKSQWILSGFLAWQG